MLRRRDDLGVREEFSRAPVKNGTKKEQMQESQRTVLIVEEDGSTRSQVAAYLREMQYVVLEAAAADEAKAILTAEGAIGAAICNVSLTPNLAGHEFLQWVGLCYPDLPVLFTSFDRYAANLIDKANTRKFVAKPYVLSNIAEHLGQLFKQ
jgi:DNA-binding NtrC family response regulator